MHRSKSAIVTGSTRGIGLAIAHALAKAGCIDEFRGRRLHVRLGRDVATRVQPKRITTSALHGTMAVRSRVRRITRRLACAPAAP